MALLLIWMVRPYPLNDLPRRAGFLSVASQIELGGRKRLLQAGTSVISVRKVQGEDPSSASACVIKAATSAYAASALE
jgi:hypothetical protein